MNKVEIKLETHEDKIKQKAMKAVSGLSGVVSVEVDMTDKKLTLKGDTDPMSVMAKLKKVCHAKLIYVGPAKEEKKDESKKKEDSTKENVINPVMLYETYPYYNHHMMPQYNPYYYCVEEVPSCVIL